MSISKNIEASLTDNGIDPLFLFVAIFFACLIAFAAANPRHQPKPMQVATMQQVETSRSPSDSGSMHTFFIIWIAVAWFFAAFALIGVVAAAVAVQM